jgi:2-polyprenyl-6-methoxyphenol hydroxylase-like FAD-dependent oxidoreductase
VTIERGGTTETIQARLVVGADGRTSMLRRPFGHKRDADFLVIAGVLLDDMQIADDTGLIYLNPQLSYGAYLFPQGRGRVRAYVAFPSSEPFRLAGEQDFARFVDVAAQAGAPRDAFAGVRVAGPLASFEGADHYVDHPYQDGVVLVGDAAASNDPSWGQGLSITLRDVRVLRDCLLKSDDWESACQEYAREHDRHYGVMHEVTLAFKEMFLRAGPAADALRARALPLIGADPMRVPDHLFSGPDLPWDAAVRARFFAEESGTA